MITGKKIGGSSLTSTYFKYIFLHGFKAILTMTLLFSSLFHSRAQPRTDYSVHANIIYHFTKYIDWPVHRKSGDFIIGVVAETPLYEELRKNLTGKKAGSQNIVVKRFSPTHFNYDCHILVLSEEESGSLKKITTRTQTTPVLLVCEEEGTARRGACISFNVVAARLTLEINKNNIEKRDLRIANELLRLGTIVK